MTITLQPVRVYTESEDEEGLLVFVKDRLVAVLVRLSDQHDDKSGRWFLEHGFGRLDGPQHPTFEHIGAAENWILTRLGRVAPQLI